MAKKKRSNEWPTLTLPCPDGLESQLLRYWDDIFDPAKEHYVHPDDVKAHKKYRKAIKTLLKFFES